MADHYRWATLCHWSWWARSWFCYWACQKKCSPNASVWSGTVRMTGCFLKTASGITARFWSPCRKEARQLGYSRVVVAVAPEVHTRWLVPLHQPFFRGLTDHARVRSHVLVYPWCFSQLVNLGLCAPYGFGSKHVLPVSLHRLSSRLCMKQP